MNKLNWINVSKGIGILSVVAGHTYEGEITRNIFIFHMPLFFFISGYLLKPTKDYDYFFNKKSKHLLVPYVFFLAILYPSFYGLPHLNIKEIAEYFYVPIMGGSMLNGALGVFWFVSCLFLTQQLMNYLIFNFHAKTMFVIVLIFFIVSFFNTYNKNIWLPWNSHVLLAASPIYYIGYYSRQVTLKVNKIYIFILGFLILIFSGMFPNNVYDMKFTNYGYPFITLFSSLILILNIKHFSLYISKYKHIEKCFSELGRASMIIMYLHLPFLLILKNYKIENNHIQFIVSIFSSYLCYLLFIKSKYTRLLILGKSTN